MATKITYNNKTPIYERPTVVDVNKITAGDMNSIKKSVNEIIDEMSQGTGATNLVNGQAAGSVRTVNAYDETGKLLGENAQAIGYQSTASGYGAHAEGGNTVASGNYSHAEGEYSTAKGVGSHAEGAATIATGNYTHVEGSHNIEDTAGTYAHIVGNGTSSARSNAHTLDWDGNAWYAGNIYLGGTNQSIGSSKVLTKSSALSDLGITATATELNYTDGVTSAIQTQLNNKAPYEIKTSTDFNSMTTPGLYTMRASSTNAPTTGSYHSLIVNKSDSGSYVQQIAIKESTTDVYVRYLNSSTWSSWVKLLTSSSLLDAVYPKGSIYMSMENVSPQSFLGGTWEPLEGSFLIGAGNSYSVGKTGGSTEHTHSYSHTHGVPGSSHSHSLTSGYAYVSLYAKNVYIKKITGVSWNCTYTMTGSSYNASASDSLTTGTSLGGSSGSTTPGSVTTDSQSTSTTGSASNMPPYLAVYMWKRKA